MAQLAFAALCAGSCAVLCGCVAPKRAGLVQLSHRAVFDLGCAQKQLHLHHIDTRTKAVTGCGRRLVYVEHCDESVGPASACSWRLDTPSFDQVQWPQYLQAQRNARPATVSPQNAPAARTRRVFRTDLSDTDEASVPSAVPPSSSSPTPQPASSVFDKLGI